MEFQLIKPNHEAEALHSATVRNAEQLKPPSAPQRKQKYCTESTTLQKEAYKAE